MHHRGHDKRVHFTSPPELQATKVAYLLIVGNLKLLSDASTEVWILDRKH